MTRWLIGLAVLAAVAGGLAADAPKKDIELLDGDWKVVRSVTDGKEQEAGDQPLRLRIKAGRILILQGEEPPNDPGITLRLDASADPKLVDVHLPNKSVLEGVYKLDARRWIICVRSQADVKDRPTSLEVTGEGVTLLEFERED